MKLLAMCWLLMQPAFVSTAQAEVIYNGQTAQQSAAYGGPSRHGADMSQLVQCRSGATHCLVANASRRQLTLFTNGKGKRTWDIIMLPPRRTMRGFINEIILDPTWCLTPSLRAKYPDLPRCLQPGDPRNAMGEAKITMTGDFAGTAIRIHDTPGFGSSWPNEDSSGCVRMLNLKQELLPLIAGGTTEVVFTR